MSLNNNEKFSNREIVHLLRSVAAAHLIKNKNRFRIIAYENAADTVEHMTRELRDIWQEGKLADVPSIGSTMAEALDEYFSRGASTHFKAILADIPETVFDLMRVPSIGPKKAYKLVKTFKLNDRTNLFENIKKLGQKNKIAKTPTFGKKSQEAILKAIAIFEDNTKATVARRMPLPYAYSLAMEVITYLKKSGVVKRADALGSLRRKVATIGDVDIAVACKYKDTKTVLDQFLKHPNKIAVDNAGEKKASIIVSPNIRVDLRVQEQDSYGAMLQYFTGSKSHNIKLREYALKKGYSLSEWGIKKVKTNQLLKFKTEEEFYAFLGLQYIPPEIREGTYEVEIAANNKIPKLVEIKDIKGDFHLHSSYNLQPSHDLGANSYSQILDKAIKLGYTYVGFSDHNPKISGLTKNQIVTIMSKRHDYIKKTLHRYTGKIVYYIGLETDILPNGDLALPEEALVYVDYLIISVHSVFNLDRDKMTQRVVKALANPKVKVLGHPTGRLLNRREGFEMGWEKIFAFCQQSNIAVEINSWPQRLDLPDTLVYKALESGVKLIVDTDAHATEQMDNMFYGVAVARRGWATKNDIINALDQTELDKWMRG